MLRDANSRRFALSLFGLAIFTAALFSPCLGNGFVLYWDDVLYLHENPGVMQFDLHDVFTRVVASNYHPITLLTLALERRLFGLDPAVFHATNVALHVLNVVLVVLLLRRLLGGDFAVPLLAGALFAVHPLHVEPVAWISERKGLLSTALYLGALLAWVRFCEHGRAGAYLGALALGLLALASKPMAVTLPAALLLVDGYLRRGPLARVLLEKLPFAALAVGAVVVNAAVRSASLASPMARLGPWELARTGLDSLVFYLSRSFAPVGLSAIYDARLVELEPYQYALAIAAVAAAGSWVVARRAHWRELAWGVLFFAVAIAPVLKFIPFGGVSLFNDRYMYLPSAGLCLAVALPFRGLRGWPRAAKLIAGVGWAAALVALSALSFQRIGVWRDSGTLFQDVLDRYPDCGLALSQLGLYYANERSEPGRAIALFERAIQVQPGLPRPYVALAHVQARLGNADEAGRAFDSAIEVLPDDLAVVQEAALFHQQQGHLARAIELYERALPRTRDPRAYHNLGLAYLQRQDRERAERSLRIAIELDPRQGPSYDSLLRLYLERGERDRARQLLEQAVAAGAPVDPAWLRQTRPP